ncbi:MAG: alkanesulfonate monooxygenase SsuD [Gammaproteobacteria bacterium]|jgi:alkanesulfonate monooxygenase SsuD/methylene tetrahydromethanopterin reductase-like flavin-dependent oxidoreductase (luciferase family)
MAACHALWNSWEDDALVMDREAQVFADPDKAHKINFVGRHYQTQGPFTVVPSARRRPFLFQAGQSDRGRAFAARHAEGIFSAARGVRQMREFSDGMAARLDKASRDPTRVPIYWAAQPIVAKPEPEAQARSQEIRERIPIEASLAQMSAHWDLDLSSFDLDAPTADLEIPGTRGLFEMYQKSDPAITLRQIAKTYMLGSRRSPFVGTAKQVADAMEHVLESGGVTDFRCRRRTSRRTISPISLSCSFQNCVDVVATAKIIQARHWLSTFETKRCRFGRCCSRS